MVQKGPIMAEVLPGQAVVEKLSAERDLSATGSVSGSFHEERIQESVRDLTGILEKLSED